MVYPRVTELCRAGRQQEPFPRSQAVLVAMSLRAKPNVKVDRPAIERRSVGGI
jgi:hypothetical protein